MYFDLGMGVEDIADEFVISALPGEYFDRSYPPIYIHPMEIAHVIGKEKVRLGYNQPQDEIKGVGPAPPKSQ